MGMRLAMCHYVRVCVCVCRVSFEKNVLGVGHSYALNFITPCTHAPQGIKRSVSHACMLRPGPGHTRARAEVYGEN